MSSLFYNVLRPTDQEVLRKIFRILPETFYMAGGTGLALQIGHRQSFDLDLFSPELFQNDSVK